MRFRKIIGGLVGVLVLAAAGAWVERAPLLASAGTRLIERAGWGPARFKIERIGFSSATLTGIRPCAGAVSAQRIELNYNLFDLASLRLTRAIVADFDAKATEAGGPIKLGTCAFSLSLARAAAQHGR